MGEDLFGGGEIWMMIKAVVGTIVKVLGLMIIWDALSDKAVGPGKSEILIFG